MKLVNTAVMQVVSDNFNIWSPGTHWVSPCSSSPANAHSTILPLRVEVAQNGAAFKVPDQSGKFCPGQTPAYSGQTTESGCIPFPHSRSPPKAWFYLSLTSSRPALSQGWSSFSPSLSGFGNSSFSYCLFKAFKDIKIFKKYINFSFLVVINGRVGLNDLVFHNYNLKSCLLLSVTQKPCHNLKEIWINIPNEPITLLLLFLASIIHKAREWINTLYLLGK